MSLVSTIQSLIFALVVPFHILLLCTLVKYRKTKFSSSFFTLLASLTLSDVCMCVLYVFYDVVLKSLLQLYRYYPGMIVWRVSLGTLFMIGNNIGVLMIGVNRFIFIVFSFKADLIWGHKSTMCSVAIQWILGGVAAVFNLHPRGQRRYINGTDLHEAVDPKVWANYGAFLFLFNFGCGIALLLLYGACCLKLVVHRLKKQETGNNEAVGVKTELQNGLTGFVLGSVLIVCSGLYLVVLVLQNSAFYLALMFVIAVNFYINPFVAFLLSSTLREYAAKLLAKRPKRVSPATQTKAAKNELVEIN